MAVGMDPNQRIMMALMAQERAQSAPVEPEPEPMSPGMAALRLIKRRAPVEAQEFVEQAPINAAMMAAGPVVGGIGKAAAAHPGITAALMGGAGLLTSTSEAGAPQLTRKQQRQMEMERMRIQAEADARRQEIEAQTAAAKARGESEANIATERQSKEAELAEYQNQVKRAEMARDFELSRDRRFSDTAGGKIYDAMGGTAPIVAGALLGAGSRLATGPGATFAGKAIKDYVAPIVSGAGAGAAAYNLPLGYDAFSTEAENPQKRGYSAYARELPPKHARKQEFTDYAAGLPDANPVRAAASKEFYDGLAKRSAAGALEGAIGGEFGAQVVRTGGRIWDGVSKVAHSLLGKSAPAPTAHWTRQQRINGRFGPMKKRP
jgi:hypothetical protein